MSDKPTDDQVVAQNNDRAGDKMQHDVSHAKPRTAIIGLLFVITLLLAAGGLYLAFQNRDDGLSTFTTVNNLLDTVATLSARVADIETQQEQLRERQAVMSRSVQDMVNALPGSNEDWALLEIEFLLIIAVHHLELERNITAALNALQTAGLRLRGLGTAALDPVREQLTADIKNLQQLNTVDTENMARFLNDLASRVNSLPLAGANGKVTEQTPDAAQKPQVHGQGLLRALWQELRNLVVIRHENQLPQTLLGPNQEYFIYQNLRLELESARLSLLRRDTENLHASVATLQQWLKEYFDTNDPAIVNIMTTMQKLSSLDLEPPVPDINSSLESLRTYIREKDGPIPLHEQDQGPQI